LRELTVRLKQAAGANLQAVVLYGSAATDEFRELHSDVNILCLLARLDAAELAKLQPVGRWWLSKGHPAPVVFSLDELKMSADVFCIELLDMKQGHRMLFGEDFFGALDVPMDLHRLQVERELRTNVIRLRQALLRLHDRREELLELMAVSSSSFAALFRHALIALGERPPDSRRATAERLATVLGFDGAGFLTVLDLREGNRRAQDLDIHAVFAGYLEFVGRVAQEMDRRLGARP
jgi:hypothetical protein